MNSLTIGVGILVLVIVVWVAYGYLSIRNIEEPHYRVVREGPGYEVREYDAYIVAETTVSAPDYRSALNKGFTLIAGYIFGDNTTRASIAMTAPVGESAPQSEAIAMTVPVGEAGSGTERVISFVMPARYTLATLPVPNNPAVKLREVPAHLVAVLGYSWSTSATAIDTKKQELLTRLSADKVHVVGAAEAKFYNPPWTPPFMLRNEIQVPISE